MSPILKRDIHEQLKHAKRLALAAAGRTSDDDTYDHQGEYDWEDGHGDANVTRASTSRLSLSSSLANSPKRELSYASGSNPRQGIGVEDVGGDPMAGEWREPMSSPGVLRADAAKKRSMDKVWERDTYGPVEMRDTEEDNLVKHAGYSDTGVYPPRRHSHHQDAAGRDGLHRVTSLSADDSHSPANKLVDLRNLLFEVSLYNSDRGCDRLDS